MAIPPPPGPQQPEGQYPPPGTPPHPPAPYPRYPSPQGPFQQSAQPPYAGSYQPWGQGYSPYNRPVPFNGLAIAALVLGILCFLPAVGLVLGIVALVQIKRRGERGKGMAVAGMVMSSIGVVLLALTVATGGARAFWEGFEDAGGGSAFSLELGECFDTPGGSLKGLAIDVDKVPCTGEHDAEVFADFEMAEGDYPGQDALADEADRRCYLLRNTYAMDSWAVPGDVAVYSFTPTAQSWRTGDREVSCLFGNTDEESGLTGSLRNDQLTLDADQYSYLSSAAAIDNALDGIPDTEYIDDDLPGYKEWADHVSEALAWEADGLPAHRFAPDAAKLVAVLAKDLERSAKEWAKAADAPDVDTFSEHYEKALKLIDPKKTVTTRKALGLATTPPVYGDGGGTGSGGEGGAGIEV
ncbi:DUF4190 domain-containing protein [Streptomyces sp. NPDC059371]|uniref:DUF4190 domain-containing protein n=1 Tax=Streptomyces sp. NPDC059371 TaxID=3346812 RepID=UPI00369C56D1